MFFKHIDYMPVLLNANKELKFASSNGYPYAFSETATDINSFVNDVEKIELISRANWLIDEVIVNPDDLIEKMPDIIGRQYQGQWAIYACSMTEFALSNIIRKWPDLAPSFLPKISDLIEMVLSDEIRYYDTMEWHEDALATLYGNKSHMTYLSILAWMITNYRLNGGSDRYDALLEEICDTLARRMRQSKDLNLPSFPNRIVFLPDMMFALIALKNYGQLCKGRYDDLIDDWLRRAKTDWTDRKTGLLISQYYPNGRRGTIHGSYAALNCTCLTMLDEDFALSQYRLLKRHFARYGKYCGIREYLNKNPEFCFHIDAGPIIQGLSPTGTSFALGATTYFGDIAFRDGLLRTAELAGKTIVKDGKCHYKLAEIMLTGEAITLAMRTNFPICDR